ncbi:universal stress protein [Micromonospora sp. WMMD737]|uniref:universal stress protein n=1 Tax=Micromonospora sp. WMMD737 TaxID=3404113 RepID=UPI003B92C9A1
MSRLTSAGRVVVGVDRSPSGLAALRAAVRLAQRDEVPLDAVRAWTFVPLWRPGIMPWIWQSDLTGTARSYVREAFEAALGGMPRGVDVRVVAEQGYPGHVLVEHAGRQTDLLVVGSPRRGWRVLPRFVVAATISKASFTNRAALSGSISMVRRGQHDG